MQVNQEALDLIKEFEGFRAKAYPDPGTGGDPWTIGYGTTGRAGVGIDPKPGMTITKAEAEHYLQKGVNKFAAKIEPYITAPINENEFGAFVSLAYNIGPGAFRKSSSLRHFNAGNKARAAQNMLLWNKAGGRVLNGLVRRRKAERALFERPVSKQTVKPKQSVSKPTSKKPVSAIGILLTALAAAFAYFMKG